MKTNLALAAVLLLAGPSIDLSEGTERIPMVQEGQTIKRKKSAPARALARFYGYASDRKGKGQKKREASQRHAKGWK